MDVIDAGADFVRVVEVVERFEQFHVGARGFDGDDVGVQVGNRLHDVVEFAVAHVGVDLCLVFHAVGADAEGVYRPVEVGLPLFFFQRQAFAQRRFVDLDDAEAGFFQIQHFVADGKRDLQAGVGTRLVVAHEGPVQDGYRAGEHRFHRALGQALCVFAPLDGHGFRAGDVAEDDRRLDAARAVGLYPGEAGEDVAVELFAEVFDHVVALSFAVHEDVNVQLLLDFHTFADVRLHVGDVLGFANRAFFVVAT